MNTAAPDAEREVRMIWTGVMAEFMRDAAIKEVRARNGGGLTPTTPRRR